MRDYEDFEFFNGNFVIIDKTRNYNIKIHSVNNENYYGKSHITIDNLEFNKYFKVTAENEEDIQQYLTPSLIQFIADFREKYGIDFEIIFKDKIYIRFFTGDMFEPKMFGKIVDEYSVYKFYVITKFAKELVEKLGIDN